MLKSASDSPERAQASTDKDEILLGVLNAIDRDAKVSQRTISRELDIALGLANAYLKRCMRKGWIRIQQVPRRRYLYYLTPKGLSEKTRLTGQYLSSSFTFFRRARQQMSDLMEVCAQRNWNRIAFAGVSELAEVGTICAHEFPVTIVCVVDGSRAGQTFCGIPVHGALGEAEPVDAVIVTSLDSSADVYRTISDAIGEERTLVPPIIRLALPNSVPAETAKDVVE